MAVLIVAIIATSVTLAAIGDVHQIMTLEGSAYRRNPDTGEIVQVTFSAELQVVTTDIMPKISTYKVLGGAIDVEGVAYSISEGHVMLVRDCKTGFIDLWASSNGQTLHLVGRAVAYDRTSEGILWHFKSMIKIDGTLYFANATLLTYKVAQE
ncbi:MAG: hypothetical protein ACXQTU_00345 [Candidatus Nezhaarchaeales archaeon]